jgi:hypothetical protein
MKEGASTGDVALAFLGPTWLKWGVVRGDKVDPNFTEMVHPHERMSSVWKGKNLIQLGG